MEQIRTRVPATVRPVRRVQTDVRRSAWTALPSAGMSHCDLVLCVSKNALLFTLDNFVKCRLIFIILSLLTRQEICNKVCYPWCNICCLVALSVFLSANCCIELVPHIFRVWLWSTTMSQLIELIFLLKNEVQALGNPGIRHWRHHHSVLGSNCHDDDRVHLGMRGFRRSELGVLSQCDG